MAKEKEVPAVGYIRMSTDKQEDSPARQRGEIEKLAEREGYRILRWYEDHGLTGTESANRPQFQLLLKDVAKREFQAVLLYEHSRFSREDVFEAMTHWKALRDAEVKLVSCQRGELRFDDLPGLITAIVGQHEARGESIRIAHRALSGRTLKAERGIHTMRPPFGFDREVFDESGAVVRRVPWNEKFSRPRAWTSRLVPSADPVIVDAVRYMFRAAAEGKSLRHIAAKLNRDGLKGYFGATFDSTRVKQILVNPVYVGVLRFGYRPRGKFARHEDTIYVPDAHAPLIDRATFDRVQTILRLAHYSRGASEPGRYLLSGLAVCGHCGRKMYGWMDRKERYRKGFSRAYKCQGSKDGMEECPFQLSVSADGLEAVVLRAIRDRILCDENREWLAEAARQLEADSAGPCIEEQQLTELRRKIERGLQNLALAEGDNFDGISRLLDRWREQEQALLKRLRAAPAKSLSVDTVNAFAGLARIRDNLHLASRASLQAAIRESVTEISVSSESRKRDVGTVGLKRKFGFIRFHEALLQDRVIQFNDWELYPDRQYFAIADYVRQAGRDVHCDEMAEVLGVSPRQARYHALRAVMAGLLERSAIKGRGWRYVATADAVS